MHKKTVSVGLTIVLALSTLGFAGDASADDDDDELTPRSWTMVGPDTPNPDNGAVCPTLPPGTVLHATGLSDFEVRTKVRNGVTYEKWTDHVTGTATDQDGNTYEWVYDNKGSRRNSANDPELFHADLTDSFRLEGNGPIEISAGFVAVVVEDVVALSWAAYPKSSYGTPIDFPFGAAQCDPI